MSRLRYYKQGGERYYVISVAGYAISPAEHVSSSREVTTYAVLDRDWAHREMGVFVPESRGRSQKQCRNAAEAFAEKLNRLERRDAD